MTRHLKPWVCDVCRTVVKFNGDRRIISLDSMDEKSSKRYRRVKMAQVCVGCAADLYERAESGSAFRALWHQERLV